MQHWLWPFGNHFQSIPHLHVPLNIKEGYLASVLEFLHWLETYCVSAVLINYVEGRVPNNTRSVNDHTEFGTYLIDKLRYRDLFDRPSECHDLYHP